MRSQMYDRDDYVALCRGLERMAALYKSKRSAGSGGRGGPLLIKALGLALNAGPKEALRRYRIRRSGVDEFLPGAKSGAAGNEEIRPDDYFCDGKIAVYTAEFGGYDEIREPVIRPDNIDYYLLTDREIPKDSAWKRPDTAAVIPREYRQDPVLANRWCKMHPHLLFPDYSCSVYVDANVLVVSDLTVLINRMGDFPVSMFRHKNRDCVYEEIEACVIKNKAPRKDLMRQRALLEAHGVPRGCGLAEATVIARRHREQACIDLMEDWWQAFLSGCGRDQIALIDVLWRAGIEPSKITTLGPNLYLCDLFVMMPHRRTGG